MANDTAVTKYLAEIGRKGGKASAKARMIKLTQEQRVAVARKAAAARWAKPATQADVQAQSTSQEDAWIDARSRVTQREVENIDPSVADGDIGIPAVSINDVALGMETTGTVARVKRMAAGREES